MTKTFDSVAADSLKNINFWFEVFGRLIQGQPVNMAGLEKSNSKVARCHPEVKSTIYDKDTGKFNDDMTATVWDGLAFLRNFILVLQRMIHGEPLTKQDIIAGLTVENGLHQPSEEFINYMVNELPKGIDKDACETEKMLIFLRMMQYFFDQHFSESVLNLADATLRKLLLRMMASDDEFLKIIYTDTALDQFCSYLDCFSGNHSFYFSFDATGEDADKADAIDIINALVLDLLMMEQFNERDAYAVNRALKRYKKMQESFLDTRHQKDFDFMDQKGVTLERVLFFSMAYVYMLNRWQATAAYQQLGSHIDAQVSRFYGRQTGQELFAEKQFEQRIKLNDTDTIKSWILSILNVGAQDFFIRYNISSATSFFERFFEFFNTIQIYDESEILTFLKQLNVVLKANLVHSPAKEIFFAMFKKNNGDSIETDSIATHLMLASILIKRVLFFGNLEGASQVFTHLLAVKIACLDLNEAGYAESAMKTKLSDIVEAIEIDMSLIFPVLKSKMKATLLEYEQKIVEQIQVQETVPKSTIDTVIAQSMTQPLTENHVAATQFSARLTEVSNLNEMQCLFEEFKSNPAYECLLQLLQQKHLTAANLQSISDADNTLKNIAQHFSAERAARVTTLALTISTSTSTTPTECDKKSSDAAPTRVVVMS